MSILVVCPECDITGRRRTFFRVIHGFLMPLSEDSTKALLSAKKGKPCKFVLVGKGSKVHSVVAYRQGGEGQRITEAKDEAKKVGGTGQPTCGVVEFLGEGHFSFKLLKADGYQAAPVTDKALKAFLNEGTDLKAKPTVDLVDALPAVEMEGGQPQHGAYRTGDQWKTVIAEIQLAKDKQERDTKLALAAKEWNDESQRVTAELQVIPDSQAALAAQETLRKVSEILKKLTTGPQLPPLPETPQQQPGQRPLGPPPQRQPPPTPGQQQPGQRPLGPPPQRQPPPTPGQQQVPQMPPLPQTPPRQMPPVPLTPAEQERETLKKLATTK